MKRNRLRVSLAVAAVVAGAQGAQPPEASSARPRTWNTALVGHLNPGGGFNGDVWVHRSVAYLGGWGYGSHCPVRGVRAISVRKPATPRLASRFARFRGTTSEDVWVGRVRSRFFDGDLAAVGIQLCSRTGSVRSRRTFRGLALYDVTNPWRPRLLSRLSSGRRTTGVHELSVAERLDGQILVLATVPHSLAATGRAKGDVRVVDVTNPRRPRELADWDFRRDGPRRSRRRLVAARGFDELLAHSAWPFGDGMKAFVSHWDAGEVFLDLADPRRPRYLGRTRYPRRAHGNAHSAWFGPEERIFVQNDEVGDFYHGTMSPERGWGFQRVFDASKPSRPVAIGRFATENSVPGRDGRIGRNGFYSVHNNVIVGDVQYVSWYSDGVRIVSLADPRRPREIGYFIPPASRDPQGFWRAPNGNRSFPDVWGVYPHAGLVFASDINSGLWIFRVNGLVADREPRR